MRPKRPKLRIDNRRIQSRIISNPGLVVRSLTSEQLSQTQWTRMWWIS